ncbi:TIGR03619 family F420-dependent LLM class oxidoreductase [Blastococcus sp. BMG 814]|uniref:TIGR03619 family F420-dependent LLM class oxidoreductase n=1 Tax=Blastococcus carthaginiensis TaxID=3050034 RepID=A0ABT9IBE5_9ACTN|nr:TIGR03619 family F420-dependent LLM class oxidoreductase [Blastococcus carthaginiensis]MDP5182499.1 TIGR03619 family F420-dependent LLM class oxidoreductase [Blastococcus carthaginiensis]
MRIGAILPTAGPLPLELGVVAMAQAAADAGAAGLWVGDHLVLPQQTVHNYPYSPDGRLAWDPERDYLEALTTCAYIAGAVQSGCTVGTAVLVLPQRNVLQTAKEVATIDRLTGGRLQLGLGAGWNDVEMAALGYRFATRGRRFDEMLVVLRDAWQGRTSGFKGTEIDVPASLGLFPRPAHPDGPPLLVGGNSPASLRRAAQLADGWLALAAVDTWDAEQLRTGIADLRAGWDAAGRPGDPRAVLKLHCPEVALPHLARRVAETAELGFDEVAVELPWHRGIDDAAGVLDGLTSTRRP